jgi:manganese-dependent ADP-ribose/CDP-alcohol diphosphatase
MAGPPPPPRFRFGVIADVQYCDRPDGLSFDGIKRHYRGAYDCLRWAVDDWTSPGTRIDFIAQLGDLIDGQCAKDGQRDEALALLLAEFQRCGAPVVHCIGNHELYNFDRRELRARLATAPPPAHREYYAFVPAPGWRVLVLDPYQIAVIGRDPTDPEYREAAELLRRHNPNDVFNEGVVWAAGLTGTARRWLPYNGALGPQQLQWLRAELTSARAATERVLILSHVPLHPDVAFFDVVWDYEEALGILAAAGGAVVAVLAGHSHPGGYLRDTAGIHHVVFPSPLNCGRSDRCHGHVEVHEDRVEVVGRGIVPSLTLMVPPPDADAGPPPRPPTRDRPRTPTTLQGEDVPPRSLPQRPSASEDMA